MSRKMAVRDDRLNSSGGGVRQKTHRRCGLALALLAFVPGGQARLCAQCPETKLLASDAHCGGIFGAAVAIEGDVLAVGAPETGVVLKNPGPGAVYVYRRSDGQWVEEQKLAPADMIDWDRFGMAVDLSGSRVIAGAQDHTATIDRDGAAYIFRWDGTTWIQEQKLVPADPALLGHFGGSVSLDGDVAAISATQEEFGGGDESGAVYVFRYNGSAWVQEAKLVASDARPFWHMGSVALHGNVIVAGATGAGAAYVYRFSGAAWSQEQKLIPWDGNTYRRFGGAVALFNDRIIVGAEEDDFPVHDAGSVYVFRRSGVPWVQEKKLLPSDPSEFLHFGGSVALLGNTAVVGAIGGNRQGGLGAGAVYAFCENNGKWPQKLRLTASDATEYDNLGVSLDLDSGYVISGAAYDNDACPADPFGSSGSAYVFDVRPCLTCIPAISPLGLAVLAVLVGAVGSAIVRRRASTRSATTNGEHRRRCDENLVEEHSVDRDDHHL